MKIDFQNLGTIKKTTLDLRPLTVIVGPNNTSKTYLAYCVHGLLKALRGDPAPPWSDDKPVDFVFKRADLVAETQALVKNAASDFTQQLAEYFQDTYGGLFNETKLDIRIDEKEILAALRDRGLSVGARQDITLEAPRFWSRNALFRACMTTL